MLNISVIIPAYNRAGLICETLRSLLNQTLPAREIIVVDDGSTDGTAEVAEREFSVFSEQFSAKSNIQNPTLKTLRQANAGPGAARNRGLKKATGEFIHFFDSDDIAAPNKHEVQLQALLDTGADIAYGPWCKGRFINLTTEDTTEHQGGCEMEQSQIGPKGEGVGATESKNTEEKAVLRLASQAGAAFSNSSRSELARDSENPSLIRSADGPAEALDSRLSTLDTGPWNFVPEGPVLQARGLPEGDLIKALLTNWSIVPHACLFRRSILEKAGGFPEDIWVGEDQLFFLRCLLAGAKVVHSPGTMVYYRVGDDPGKLTATGVAQKRHARDWGRFLLSAKKEIDDRRSKIGEVPAEAQRRGDISTTDNTDGHGYQKTQQGGAQGTCAGASEPDSLPSKLADAPVPESLTRCASGPALALCADDTGIGSAGANQLADSKEVLEGRTQAVFQMHSHKLQSISTANDAGDSKGDSSSVPIRDIRGFHSVVLDPGLSTLDAPTSPAEWYAFRLRAYEAWRDLENFFPVGERELKKELEGIWRGSVFSGIGFRLSGFLLRKLAGLKLRMLGYREHASFRCGRPSQRAGQKIAVRPS